MAMKFNAELEKLAREDYEAARQRVSGRPKWEKLNPNDPYDAGMIDHAFAQARLKLAQQRAEADRDHDETMMPGGFP